MQILNLKYPVILASKSPRRKQLLDIIGLENTVVASSFDENSVSETLEPKKYVIKVATGKLNDIIQKHQDETKTLFIAADTTVILEGEKLNKPKDKVDAINMLKKLSGKTHSVYTGLAIGFNFPLKFYYDFEETKVTFRELNLKEIEKYVESGSPLDKAGAYGIQDDFGAVFVSRIDGCYYNVVGLPLQKLYVMLSDISKDESESESL